MDEMVDKTPSRAPTTRPTIALPSVTALREAKPVGSEGPPDRPIPDRAHPRQPFARKEGTLLMDSRRPTEAAPAPEAVAFVRFCYRRRRAGWPELYDEMCAVASRRLYNGWGFTELADHGIGFSLFETPTLAALAREVAREDTERRTRTAAFVLASAEEAPITPAPLTAAIAVIESVTSLEDTGQGEERPDIRPVSLRLAATTG